MSDAKPSEGAVIALRRQSVLFMVIAVINMVTAVVQSRSGQSGAVWIAIGATFLALGGAAAGRAKKMAGALKAPPSTE